MNEETLNQNNEVETNETKEENVITEENNDLNQENPTKEKVDFKNDGLKFVGILFIILLIIIFLLPYLSKLL